jgi:hypothetical protein
MFRIECFCEDRKLHLALRALTGITRGMPTVQPVTNVHEDDAEQETIGEVQHRVRATTDGSQTAMLAQYIHKKKVREINTDFIREFLKSIGASSAHKSAASNLARRGKEAGLLTVGRAASGRRPGSYRVVAKAVTKLIGEKRVHRAKPPRGNSGKVKNGSEDIALQFQKHIASHRLETVRAADAKTFMEAHGYSPASRTYLLQKGVAAGYLKKNGMGSGTFYTVTPQE